MAAIVDALGQKVRNFKMGDRVIGGLLFEFDEPQYSSGWGGFCEYTLAADHDAMVDDGVADPEHGWFECYEIQRAVPGDIPVEAAVLLCTWREVYAGFGDFNLQKRDDVLIFGAGPVGLSFLTFGKLLGLSYIAVVDPLDNKRRKALEMGADAVFSPRSEELKELTAKRGKPLDVVIDAVGNSSIINTALPLIKLGGSVGVYGVIPEPQIAINKGAGSYNFNPLALSPEPEAGLKGAALLGAAGAGLIDNLAAEAVGRRAVDRRVQPQTANAGVYEAALREYCRVYNHMLGFW